MTLLLVLAATIAVPVGGCTAVLAWFHWQDEPFTPDADELTPLPPGLTAVERGEPGCGSGSCSRSFDVTGGPGVDGDDVLAAVRAHVERRHGVTLDAGGTACWELRPPIDRRSMCVEVTGVHIVDGADVVRVSLGGARSPANHEDSG